MKRIALLGYGTAGAVFHGPLLRAAPEVELAAVVTSDPARRARAQHDLPGVPVRTADELWRRPQEVDAVVIATPNTAHLPLAVRALRAGLGVVVDKPVALDAAQARELAAVAAETARPATVFHNRRWDGDFLTVAGLISAGRLGQVTVFESAIDRWRPLPRSDSWRERDSPGQGGGLLLDLGSHLVDQAVWLFGPVRSIFARLAARRPDVAGEDELLLITEHAAGVQSRLSSSALGVPARPRFLVNGTAGGFRKEGFDVQEEQLRAGLTPGGPGWGDEPETRWGSWSDGQDTAVIRTEPGRWQTFYPAFAAALDGPGQPVPVPVADAVHVMAVLDAARRSAMTGSAVAVDQP